MTAVIDAHVRLEPHPSHRRPGHALLIALLALAESDLEEGTHVEPRAILSRLGVVATPRIPMP